MLLVLFVRPARRSQKVSTIRDKPPALNQSLEAVCTSPALILEAPFEPSMFVFRSYYLFRLSVTFASLWILPISPLKCFQIADTVPPRIADTVPPRIADTVPPRIADTVPPQISDTVPPQIADTVPPQIALITIALAH